MHFLHHTPKYDILPDYLKISYIAYILIFSRRLYTSFTILYNKVVTINTNHNMKANNNKQDFYTERINSYNKFDYMNGHDFEYFCADLLTKNGFVNVEITQKTEIMELMC